MVSMSLFLLSLLAHSSNALFSVHDDVLALPQYEMKFPGDTFISSDEASAILTASSAVPFDSSDPQPTHQLMRLGGGTSDSVPREFLCTIPTVKPPPALNATEKELSKVEEEKELARATSRGWELLSDLEGKCLYFVSGWWSYSFCHNKEVKQFHQMPPQRDNQWPPMEDPETMSYVLGKVQEGEASVEGTELQATGELRYLVQKMGGGTVCDLTKKERKIEVQFHCNSHGPDRIDWIKEISICNYLMVIYTPRLCNDVTFLPSRENKANTISCTEILEKEQQEEFFRRKAKGELEAKKIMEEAEKELEAGGKKKKVEPLVEELKLIDMEELLNNLHLGDHDEL